jgi:hypothetical protein
LNAYQRETSASKLRGQYFTPDALVDLMLDALRLSPRQRIIDPSCGDGSFLRGVVAAAARRFPGEDRKALARSWADRLIGFDIDGAAVREARLRLQTAFRERLGVNLPAAQLHVYRADVLAQPALDPLLNSVGLRGMRAGEELLVVGNPPYVEAKRLDRGLKADLRSRYPEALSGAPDLYLYFLHVCLGWLREGDRLAFVLPNKLLVNANAQRVRERLLAEPRVSALWLATQARLFGDAAVYPVVLFAERGAGGGGQGAGVDVTRLARWNGDGLLGGEAVSLPIERYRSTHARAFYAPPESEALRSALDRMLSHTPTHPHTHAPTLADVLDIRWSVSFHRSGLRERYVTPSRPASPHARRFLGGGAFSGNGEVTRYGLRWGGWWMDYDEDRLRRERNCVPEAALFEQPKVAICQNGRTLRAAHDEEGFILKDTLLCGVFRPVDHPLVRHPRALVGLLCSRAVHFFYSHVFYGGHVNGGYLHFLRSFLVDIPLGAWTEELACEAGRLVRERQAAAPERAAGLEEAIEARVSEALGLEPASRAAIREWAAADENWRLRDRVRGPRDDGPG